MNGQSEEVDLYEVLGITRGATKVEIKKAYHKSALRSHPDKVAAEDRPQAEIEFKSVQQAFEILHDDQKRQLYDVHGMAAFEKGGESAHEHNVNDIFEQMFGFGGMAGGMPFGGGRAGGFQGPRPPRRGKNEDTEYPVTLEELYKGKTTQFNSTKNVVCSTCSGSGGKDKAKARPCETCKGRGVYQKLQSVGPGLVTQVTVQCSTCHGLGEWLKDKDKCRRCKGERVVQEKKKLELYIPPGSREGERIVLQGEADQQPGVEPGDIVFHLVETEHPTFKRAGPDLAATLDITLAEALTGFDRVVLTHLDGRGIHLAVVTPSELPLEPGQCLKVRGEGMPNKRSDYRGDLYLTVRIQFPKKGWLSHADSDALEQHKLESIVDALPPPAPPIIAPGEVDERDVEFHASLDMFGAGSGDPRSGAEWEDEEEAGPRGAQCAQQ